MNPTLFSLCFAGKARRNIACAHCLSDNHISETCPDNPSRSFFWWQHPGATFPHAGGASQWVWLLQWVGLTQAGFVFATYSMLETAQNARTVRASLPMCAQPARQTIHDRPVQRHKEHRQTQVEGVECPSTSGSDCRSSLNSSIWNKTCCDSSSVSVMHTGVVIFTCWCTYLLG